MPAQNRQKAGLCRGYITEQHRAAFEAERKKHRPGGELAATCGARTNSGKACARLPVANGNGRCIQHCGRVVAAQFREQQRKKFVKGQISPEVWFKAEAKRATNRLREQWKKDPWHPGSTIDLGDEEDKFRAALSQDPDLMPAAVADWLRWRYRRLQIDRPNDQGWMNILRKALPARLAAAGSEPVPNALMNNLLAQTEPALWQTVQPSQSSKRNQPDKPRELPSPLPNKKVATNSAYFNRCKKEPLRQRFASPQLGQAEREGEMRELVRLNIEHQATLTPLYRRCRGERDRMIVLSAFRRYIEKQDDAAARNGWMAIVSKLSI